MIHSHKEAHYDLWMLVSCFTLFDLNLILVVS